MSDQFLFVEKYRPKTIDECILPDNISKIFKDIIKSGEAQNLMLSGGPGCGKTTAARAMCNELNCDTLFINASEQGNIDTLRTTIRNFASTVSVLGGGKVVILDESDNMTAATQSAFRGFIEEFAANCRFILTCNFKNKIIEPLHSRFSIIDFKMPRDQQPKLASQMHQRVKTILDREQISYDEKVLSRFILKYFPDFRKILGELQTYGSRGTIDEGILSLGSHSNVATLIKHMKEKNFVSVRKWVSENSDCDSSAIFREIYDTLSENVDKQSVPQVILILADYQYKMAFSSDPEICLCACFVEIMVNATFK